MKKYILVLLILLLSTLCYAALDTFEGETITDANNIEGCTTCDTIDGQVKKAAVAGTDFTQDANCMGAWYMNADTTADEVDRTSNGNTLAVYAEESIEQAATFVSGFSGNSRDFTATDEEFLYIADGTELDINGANQSLSIVAYVKVETAPEEGSYRGIVTKYRASTDQRQYALNAVGTGSSQFEFRLTLSDTSAAGTAAESVSSTTITYVAGTTYHVAVVYNDTDMRIYVDGLLACEPLAKTDGTFNGSTAFYIGYFPTASWFDGLIDEVAVFNDALSAAEVLEIATYGISGNKGGND